MPSIKLLLATLSTANALGLVGQEAPRRLDLSNANTAFTFAGRGQSCDAACTAVGDECTMAPFYSMTAEECIAAYETAEIGNPYPSDTVWNDYWRGQGQTLGNLQGVVTSPCYILYERLWFNVDGNEGQRLEDQADDFLQCSATPPLDHYQICACTSGVSPPPSPPPASPPPPSCANSGFGAGSFEAGVSLGVHYSGNVISGDENGGRGLFGSAAGACPVSSITVKAIHTWRHVIVSLVPWDRTPEPTASPAAKASFYIRNKVAMANLYPNQLRAYTGAVHPTTRVHWNILPQTYSVGSTVNVSIAGDVATFSLNGAVVHQQPLASWAKRYYEGRGFYPVVQFYQYRPLDPPASVEILSMQPFGQSLLVHPPSPPMPPPPPNWAPFFESKGNGLCRNVDIICSLKDSSWDNCFDVCNGDADCLMLNTRSGNCVALFFSSAKTSIECNANTRGWGATTQSTDQVCDQASPFHTCGNTGRNDVHAWSHNELQHIQTEQVCHVKK